MICAQCEHENEGQPRFCRNCGAPLKAVCPQCGSQEPGSAQFCGECGAPLARPPRATEAPVSEVTRPAAEPTDERNASVVFADISRYTSLAAAHDAGDIFFFMAEWYTRVRDIGTRYEAHFSRAEGDCVMLVLGAPTACDDHPERACRVALDIRDAFGAFAQEHGASIGADERIAVHVGVNTGPVAAGRIELGDGQAFDILGHTVNEARRLQSCAGPGRVYVGANTYERAARFFEWAELPELSLKGIPGVHKAYELLEARERRVDAPDMASPFVGREEEMRKLRRASSAALAGMGQLVAIGGEPGIGKSRLVHESSRELVNDGFRVAVSQCFLDKRAMPHFALAQILRESLLGGNVAADQDLRAGIGRALSPLGLDSRDVCDSVERVVTAGDPSESVGHSEERERATRRALRRVFVALAADRPLSIVVEDLQWVDAASLEFFRHLVPWLADCRALFMCTFRPGGAPPWAERENSTAISLGRLSPADGEALARGLLGGAAEDAASRVSERSGGNPLYIHELARAGIVAEGGAVPATVRDVIMARMDRLDAGTRRVLGIAAIVGTRFRIPLVAAVLHRPTETVVSAVEDLTLSGWVRPTRGVGDDVYEFDQILVREVAYTRLPRRDRMATHRETAEAIEEAPSLAPGENVETLVHHFSASDVPARAAPYLLSAMERAKSRDAHQSVLYYGQALLNLIASEPSLADDKAMELQAVESYANACCLAGRNQEALRLFARHRQIAEDLGDIAEIASARHLAGATHFSMAEYDRAIGELRAAMGMWQEQDRGADVARAILGLGAAFARKGDYESALTEFRLCWDSKAGYPASIRAMGHHNFGEVCTYMGRIGEALEHFDKAESLDAESPTPRLLANIHGGRAQALLAKGNAAAALESLRQAAELAERAGDVAVQAEVLIDQGQCYRGLGDLEEAVASIRQGIELARDAEAPNLVAMGRASLSRTLLLRGEDALALSVAEQARSEAQAVGDSAAAHLSQRVLADIAEREGRHDDALVLRLGNVALAVESGRRKDEAADLVDLGGTYLTLGQLDRAVGCLNSAVAVASEVDSKHIMALADERLAQLHLAEGAPAKAAECAQAAILAAVATRNDDLAWRCYYVAGRAADVQGSDADAGTHCEAMLLALASVVRGRMHSLWELSHVREALSWAEEFCRRTAQPEQLQTSVSRLQDEIAAALPDE